MSDLQYAIDNPQFPLAHFDTWVKISRALGHFWSSFSDDVMVVVRAVYAKKGWEGVGPLVEILAPLSGWGQSFKMLGGIMPPLSVEHVHRTTTGRLEIAVTEGGNVVTSVWRQGCGERVEIARFLDRVLTYSLTQEEWEALGGKDECFSQRHKDAVDEVLKYV